MSVLLISVTSYCILPLASTLKFCTSKRLKLTYFFIKVYIHYLPTYIKMADKIEQRKNAFKNKKLDSTERIRKQTEQLRKEKRSANVLAKRLKTDQTSTSQNEYSHDNVKEAITKAKVCKEFVYLGI